MPFKSKAQRRKFYAMLARGEISKAEVDKWERETKGKKLPERVKKKKKQKAKRTLKTNKRGGKKKRTRI